MSNSSFNQSQSPYASETNPGLVEQATPAQVEAGDDVGESGAPLFVVPSLVGTKTVTLESYEQMDGSVTPIPVALTNTGKLAKASASLLAKNIRNFVGFVTGDYSAFTQNIPSFINVQETTGGNNLTANAGTDRVIVFTVKTIPTTGVRPTGVSWNSQAATFLGATDNYYASQDLSLWILPIGTSLSNETFPVVITGGTGTMAIIGATYALVNQTRPNGLVYSGASGGGNVQFYPGHADGYGRLVGALAPSLNTYVPNLPATWTQRLLYSDSTFRFGDYTANDLLVFNTGTSNFHQAAIVTCLIGSGAAESIVVQNKNILSGFTGLTPGRYYGVGTTPGTLAIGESGITAGLAISATELVVANDESNKVSVEQSLTSSLPTYANGSQRFLVMVKMVVGYAAGGSTFQVLYNGVVKDTVSLSNNNTSSQYNNVVSLVYMEIPAAGNGEITVTGSTGLSQIVITLFKI